VATLTSIGLIHIPQPHPVRKQEGFDWWSYLPPLNAVRSGLPASTHASCMHRHSIQMEQTPTNGRFLPRIFLYVV
jgi:hypothetical protein